MPAEVKPTPRNIVNKPVIFRNFREDNAELNILCLKADIQLLTVFNQVEIEERDRRLVELVIKENYPVIRQVYHFVQGRSLTYPRVSADDVYVHLFKELDFDGCSRFTRAQFDQWLSGDDVLRYHFIELFVRVADFIKQSKNDSHTSVCMRHLMTAIVGRFCDTINNRQTEREKYFWKVDVERIIVLNDYGIRKLFRNYSVNNKQERASIFAQEPPEIITLADFENICELTKFKLSQI